MSDLSFAPTPAPALAPSDVKEETPHNNLGAQSDFAQDEPVAGTEAEETLLALLGVGDATGMPPEDQAYLKDATDYVLQIVKNRGATPTSSTMRRALDSIKTELDLDPQAEPAVVLERIGNLVKAWKGLVFVRDASDRRRLFMKLARLPDSKAIDNALFAEMEKRRVYHD